MSHLTPYIPPAADPPTLYDYAPALAALVDSGALDPITKPGEGSSHGWEGGWPSYSYSRATVDGRRVFAKSSYQSDQYARSNGSHTSGKRCVEFYVATMGGRCVGFGLDGNKLDEWGFGVSLDSSGDFQLNGEVVATGPDTLSPGDNVQVWCNINQWRAGWAINGVVQGDGIDVSEGTQPTTELYFSAHLKRPYNNESDVTIARTAAEAIYPPPEGYTYWNDPPLLPITLDEFVNAENFADTLGAHIGAALAVALPGAMGAVQVVDYSATHKAGSTVFVQELPGGIVHQWGFFGPNTQTDTVTLTLPVQLTGNAPPPLVSLRHYDDSFVLKLRAWANNQALTVQGGSDTPTGPQLQDGWAVFDSWGTVAE